MTLSVIALHCRLSPRARRPHLRDGEGHFYFRVCSQYKAIGQGVASADLPDQGLTDDSCFQFIKQFFVDRALDLLPCKPASGLEAEDIGRLSALERLLPDAHGGPHADISLPHGKLFLERQSREVFALRPAVHHPFAFDLHDVFLVSVFLYLF